MKASIIILLFLCRTAWTLTYSECCSGSNIMEAHEKCTEGDIKKIRCDGETFTIYFNFSEISLNSEGGIVFVDNEDSIKHDEYCISKTEDDRNVIMICAEEDKSEDMRIVNSIFSIISVVFIVLTISIYLGVPQLLDVQGLCLLQSIAGLGLSFLVLAIINLSGFISQHQCTFLAYVMYFSFLYSFFWLNIFCFHIWRTIVNPQRLQSVKGWTIIYHVVGTTGPLLFLVLLLTANYSGHSFFKDIHPGIGEYKCWFKDATSTFIYFYAPISILLVVNIVYFVWTTVVLCRGIKRCSEKKAKVHKYRLQLCIKLFFVMGISWCFEVISAVFEQSTARWFWILPDAVNALQGLLIFLILVVFRKKVVRALANKKIFRSVRLPASWRNVQDDECEELEEEMNLSTIDAKTLNILT